MNKGQRRFKKMSSLKLLTRWPIRSNKRRRRRSSQRQCPNRIHLIYLQNRIRPSSKRRRRRRLPAHCQRLRKHHQKALRNMQPPILRWRKQNHHHPPILRWKRRAATRLQHHVQLLHLHLQHQVQHRFHLQVHLLREFQNHLRIHQGNLNVQPDNHFQHHHLHHFHENNDFQQEQRFPTPPPAPKREYPQGSDTTEERFPLPRRRRESQQDDEAMRPTFAYDFDDTTNLEAYVDILTSLSDTVPDATTARERRIMVWDHIMDLVEQGVSTGSRMLDRMLLQGRDAVLTTENVYYVPYVPTAEEHFYRQDPGEAGMLFRPNLMLHMEDHEYSIDVLDSLAELGRNVLAGRAVLRDHPLNMSVEYFNTTTYYLTMVVLNLGNMKRIPYFANRKRYPSWIRENWSEMKKRLVLPYLVVNNPGHIITLCESFDFTEHNDLCIEYNVIGLQVSSSKDVSSPSISIFLKSPLGLVEFMYHWDVSHREDFWMIHAVLARCVFGPKTHDVHEGTRERTEHRYNGEPVEHFAFSSEERYNTHGCKNIVTPEDQLDPIERYEDIWGYHNCILFWSWWTARKLRWTTRHVRRACVDNSYQFSSFSYRDTTGQRHTSCHFCQGTHVICRFHHWRF